MQGAERPPTRWTHATTDLHNFGLITWAVDPDLVQRLLPDGFTVDIRAGQALVSMVPFLDHRFRFRAVPLAALSCGQVNYRTYVRLREESGVWFFGTSLDSRLVSLPRLAWRMPWHRTRIRLDASWEGDDCRSWRLDASGAWGAATVALRGVGTPMRVVAGCEGDAMSQVLCDPYIGWYARSDGSGVGRYSVWHEPLVLEEALVDEARVEVLTDLGLIEDGQPPLAAGVQRMVGFDIHTPPVQIPAST